MLDYVCVINFHIIIINTIIIIIIIYGPLALSRRREY